MADSDGQATLNLDFSGVLGTWVFAYLLLPEDVRDEARRATALNLLTTAEGGLPKDWEKDVPKVVAMLKGESVNNVSPLTKNKPNIAIVQPDDTTG